MCVLCKQLHPWKKVPPIGPPPAVTSLSSGGWHTSGGAQVSQPPSVLQAAVGNQTCKEHFPNSASPNTVQYLHDGIKLLALAIGLNSLATFDISQTI